MAYPVYPVELREAPDGTVYIKMEHGAWAWAGKKTAGKWTHINSHYELLLANYWFERPEPSMPEPLADYIPGPVEHANGVCFIEPLETT